MFEHIYFATDTNLNDFLIPENKELEDTSNNFFENYPNVQRLTDGEAFIEGRVKALYGAPIPKEYLDALMGIQSFSWMCMGKNYYTHRKNYESYLLLYTYEGNGKLCYQGNTYELHENDGFIIDCRQEHFYKTVGEKWVHSDLHFDDGMSSFLYKHCFQEKSAVFHCQDPGEYQHKLEQLLSYQNSSFKEKNFIISAKIQELLMYVLLLQNRTNISESIPESIVYLQKYLDHNFTLNITLNDMASFCNMSKYHLIRQFKKYIGYTPKEYMIHLRIARAKQLLIDTSIPSYKIGIMVGINNEANFIQIFKDRVGKTPKEYRYGK